MKPILPHLTEEVALRFWSHVAIGNKAECWEWQRSRHRTGYGRFGLNGRVIHANRLALVIASQMEPDGLLALHGCDNPACCNPAHLSWGAQARNMDEKVRRGRAYTGNQRGEHNPRAKLSEADVLSAVSMLQQCVPAAQIAARLSVSRQLISQVKNRQVWTHLTENILWPVRKIRTGAAERPSL